MKFWNILVTLMIFNSMQKKKTNWNMISNKNKKTAFILCCVGFVFPGLHLFYVGRWVQGILYIFTGGFFLIGTIVDLIKICNNKFRDNTGAYLKKSYTI